MPRRNKLKVLPVGETCRNIPDLGRHRAMRWFLPLPEWPRQVHHKAKQKRLYYLVACGFPSLNHERARHSSRWVKIGIYILPLASPPIWGTFVSHMPIRNVPLHRRIQGIPPWGEIIKLSIGPHPKIQREA